MPVNKVYLLNQNTPVIIPSGLVPKGAYDNSTDYAVGDSVDYLGSSYVMYVDAAAGTLPTDTTKWQVIANKGDTGAPGSDGADSTVSGPAGADGLDGKTILNGAVDPTTEGVDGDFYINTVSNEIFGPKAGTWGTGTSIVGPAGADGITPDLSTYQLKPSEGAFVDGDKTKLSGIETAADVTDATNVAGAGAVMDGDFSSNGVMTRTAAGTYTSRTITGTSNQVSVSNGDGVSGNPTLSTPQDIHTGASPTFAGLTAPITDKGGQVYNVKSYGAACNGSTDDTTAINLALSTCHAAGGGTVTIPNSTVISSPLVIYSNTHLQLDPATTVTLASGSNCNMLQNAGVTANRTTADGATTSASTTITSASANFTSADIGSTVIIADAGTGGQLLVTTIASVTNSTTAVIASAAGASVSNKALTIYRRDTNITISGGTWSRGSNTGSYNSLHSIFLRHLDNVTIRDVINLSSAGKYAIAIGDVTNYTATNLTFNTYSDGLHITGPAIDGYITNLYGTTGDDMVGFTSADYSTYADTAGTISSARVENIFGVNALCLIKIIGGTGVQINNIHVSGLHGTTTSSVCKILDDQTGATNCSGIVIENIDAKQASGSDNKLVLIYATAAKDITLRNLVSTADFSSVEAVKVSASASIDNLVIDGLKMEAGSSGGSVYCINLGTSTISRLNLSNIDVSSAVTSITAIVYISGALVTNINISNLTAVLPSGGTAVVFHATGNQAIFTKMNNIYLKTGGRLYRHAVAGYTDILQASNCTLDNAWDIAQVGSPMDISISNSYINNSQSHLVYVTGASSTCTIRGSALNVASSAVGFSYNSSAPPAHVINQTFPVDVATLAQTANDIAYNTNATSATVGPVMSNGYSWRPVSNFIRTGTTTSSATPSINTDLYDVYTLTAQTADITSFTTNLTGTPVDGQKLLISITGTAARAITWGTSFVASTVALPTTTVSTNRLNVGFIYDGTHWLCVAVA